MPRSLMLSLVLLLAACAPADEEGLSAEDEAKAAQMLVKYEALRAEENWELAEERADKLRSQFGESAAAGKLAATLSDTRARAEAMREGRRLIDLWDYQVIAVEGGEQRTAMIHSRVEADPEAELVPESDARMVLRRHPSWGRSAYLLLNQRELQCGPPCRLRIRFDEGPVQEYSGDPADSGTGPALFIEDEARFLEALRTAARVRIELPPSGVLVPVFEFEVGGFAPGRLDPPG